MKTTQGVKDATQGFRPGLNMEAFYAQKPCQEPPRKSLL